MGAEGPRPTSGAAGSPLLPAPSRLRRQPRRSSPVRPGSDPAAAGEGVRCFGLTSNHGLCLQRQVAGGCASLGGWGWPRRGALLLRARAGGSRGSAGRARCRPGAVGTRQASARWRGEYFGPNLSNYFFFFFKKKKKNLDFCEVNICDLCSLCFLPGGRDAAPDKYRSFPLTGWFASPLSNARCAETSTLSPVPAPLMCHFGAACAALRRRFLGGLLA